MITISKSNHTMTVTKGAFEELYKPMGYSIVGDKKPAIEKPVEVKAQDKVEEAKKPEIKKEFKSSTDSKK